MNYPASLDTGVSLPNPTTSNNTNSPSHAGLHGSENAAIIAVETKLGIGAATPAANQLLVGTGAGTSAWQGLTSAQLAAILSDETGSGSAVFATSPTLITPKVDTINENTLNNGVTVGGINFKSGAINTSSSVPAAAIQAGAVGNTQVASGVIVQVVDAIFSAVATGTTVIPSDDTIPQNTEGDQYMTLAITPKATTNKLVICIVPECSMSVGGTMQVALFQDATASAIAATGAFEGTGTGRKVIPLTHTMLAGTTSATTFKVRIGVSTAATLTFNGSGGARFYGGVTQSSMVIMEYKI